MDADRVAAWVLIGRLHCSRAEAWALLASVPAIKASEPQRWAADADLVWLRQRLGEIRAPDREDETRRYLPRGAPQCPRHRGQFRDNCAPCRSERIATRGRTFDSEEEYMNAYSFKFERADFEDDRGPQ